MIHDKHVIGIDLVRTDSEGGWYGIYESYNYGERWNMVTQSRTIESLINMPLSTSFCIFLPNFVPFDISFLNKSPVLIL